MPGTFWQEFQKGKPQSTSFVDIGMERDISPEDPYASIFLNRSHCLIRFETHRAIAPRPPLEYF